EKIIKIILFIALGIMAKYVYTFSFSVGTMSEVSINMVALPSIIASILMGPFWGALIGGATDITAHFLHPMGSFLPQITLVAIIRGFLPGFLMKHLPFKNKMVLKLFYAIGTTLVVCQVFFMSVILHQAFNNDLIDTIFFRLLIQVFEIPVFVGISYVMIKYLKIRKELREREEQFHTLVANIPDAIFRCHCDRDWSMIYMSDYIEKITGYPASDFINNKKRSFNSIIHEEDRDKVKKIVKEHISQKEPYTLDYRIINADAEIKYLYEKGQGIFSDNGELLFIDGVISDITEIIKKEEQLKKANKDLIVSQERNRIARELHDSISQNLHGINYSVHSLRQIIQQQVDSKDFINILNHLEDTVEESLQELKNMIFELKPSKLEGQGICQALVTQCEAFTERANITLTHDIDDIKKLTPEQELAVYRILQEALTNIYKHSGADQVRIFLKEIKEKVFLTITDNGKGFNSSDYKGYGLNNMKTRAFQNNGKLEIESQSNQGTVISVIFDILEKI
ncbi:MAG: folate family ECF transporter S component, partial [Halanaerobiales bacterium]